MIEIFKAIPAVECGSHEDISQDSRKFFSCGCGLADAGFYLITWDGPGLGLVCDNKEDGERKAHMMNVAWYLSKGMKYDDIK